MITSNFEQMFSFKAQFWFETIDQSTKTLEKTRKKLNHWQWLIVT